MTVSSTRALAAIAGFGGLVLVGCPRKHDDPTPQPSTIRPDGDANIVARPTTSASSAAPPAACAAAYVSWPGGPAIGADLSQQPVPMRLPAGASITIAVRQSGHEITIRGPAAVRACTADEPDVILVAEGTATVEGTSPVRPGTEVYLATPSLVAIVPRASIKLEVEAKETTWEVVTGPATITDLDTTRAAGDHEKGTMKRFDDGELLLTRCGVQTTAAASADKMLRDLAAPDASVALPASSVGILAAAQVKHARERALDCSFAEAFALSCDVAALGCKHGYAGVREYLAKAAQLSPLPPGMPVAKASASIAPSASSAPSTSVAPTAPAGSNSAR
jgi:hypothetical protein